MELPLLSLPLKPPEKKTPELVDGASLMDAIGKLRGLEGLSEEEHQAVQTLFQSLENVIQSCMRGFTVSAEDRLPFMQEVTRLLQEARADQYVPNAAELQKSLMQIPVTRNSDFWENWLEEAQEVLDATRRRNAFQSDDGSAATPPNRTTPTPLSLKMLAAQLPLLVVMMVPLLNALLFYNAEAQGAPGPPSNDFGILQSLALGPNGPTGLKAGHSNSAIHGKRPQQQGQRRRHL